MILFMIFEQGRDMYFYDVVYRKRSVFRLQKCHIHIVENFAFFQNR